MKPQHDLGKLILRLAVAGLLIFHGISKLQHMDASIGWIKGLLDEKGLPGFLAYCVFIAEVIAPVLILIGLYARLAALTIVINFLVVFYLVFKDSTLKLSEGGTPNAELEWFFLLGALAIFFLGSGKFSARGGKGTWD